MQPRAVHLLNTALIGLLFVGSLLVFEHLPAQIPTHFDLSGTPDAYQDATLLQWLILPLIALAVCGVLYGSAWFVGHRLDLVNVPNQAAFRALSRSNQRKVVRVIQRALYWQAPPLLLLFAALQMGTYEAAKEAGRGFLPYVLASAVAVFVVSIATAPWLIWHLDKTVKRLHEEQETDE